MIAQRPFIVGLTGGIGSGKSAATDHFQRLGADIVDTDVIARTLTQAGGGAMTAIRTQFGAQALSADGALDRHRMRALAFQDPAARRRLEAILHPLIQQESERQSLAATAAYVVLAVPLLVESGRYRERCQRICVVDCPEQLQIDRVRQRNGLDEAAVRAILAAQASRAQRLAVADDIIDNSGDLDNLYQQVETLHERYLHMASSRHDMP